MIHKFSNILKLIRLIIIVIVNFVKSGEVQINFFEFSLLRQVMVKYETTLAFYDIIYNYFLMKLSYFRKSRASCILSFIKKTNRKTGEAKEISLNFF